jgi:hypothetical protein
MKGLLHRRWLRTIGAMGALAGVSMLGWVAMSPASAATRVDFHSGMLNCTGTMTVMVQNMTGSSSLDATVTARALNGSVHTPSEGSAELSDIPSQSTDFVKYNCTGGSNHAIQIRTTSTSAIPSVHFTNIGGTAQTVTAGAWRVKVRR